MCEKDSGCNAPESECSGACTELRKILDKEAAKTGRLPPRPFNPLMTMGEAMERKKTLESAMPFTLEERYIVFKLSDLGNSHKGDMVRMLAQQYQEHRTKKGKASLMGVFIEQDWPEFPVVVQMLADRANGVVKTPTKSPDANVERNRELLLDRSVVGLKKYGVTTERKDLDLDAWLQHLLEELLDAANYVQAAKGATGTLKQAHDRLFDMLLGDDGQAHLEADRYLEKADPELYGSLVDARMKKANKPKPPKKPDWGI